MARKICALLFLLLAPALPDIAYAAVAVCDTTAVDADQPVTQERVVWNYHDAWYSGVYVVGDEFIEEAIPPATTATNTDLIPQADTNEHLLMGYPAAWGMDNFVVIDCLADESQREQDEEDGALAGEGELEVSESEFAGAQIAFICDVSAEDCAADAETVLANETSDSASERSASGSEPLVIVHGLIFAMEDDSLMTYDDSARYTAFSVAPAAKIERHIAADINALKTGDVVGAVLGESTDGTREALRLRVYRGVRQDSAPLATSLDAAVSRGVELRGILRNVASRSDGRAVRLTFPATGEDLVRVRSDVPVTIIERAERSAMQPLSAEVRVHAAKQPDGSLQARVIEVLESLP